MGSGLRSRLPQALGADIIHLRADLNYLHVTTAGGSAMLLYSLARAAEELGELGLVVHRAHWVACAHVARSRRTAQGLILTLSNGVDVPVSRRRQAEIRTRFGDRFQAPVTLRR
jgi:DNA-binding LytR/AlgR family response regulator